MSKVYDCLDEKLIHFIKAQKVFFVATAPLASDGHVNLSPKGYDSIRIVDETTIEWLDLGGSGVETIAHLRENERITVMFCAFEGAANILRLYGRGEVITFDDPEFETLLANFPNFDRARSIIRVKIDRIADSCGWGVPFYEFKGEREQLQRWAENKEFNEWRERRYKSNARSIDGLDGLIRPHAQSEAK